MIRWVSFAGLLVFGLLFVPGAMAGKYNAKLRIGDPAPVFKELEGVDGKRYSLDDFKNKDVVVLVITCNHCPVATDYEERIVAFARKYAGPESKLALVAISVSKEEDDSLPKMKARAKQKGFAFPYLIDPTQKIGRELGATVTPEFFVLNKERKVVFMGAMDDDPDEPKVKYLEPAVDALLKGETPKLAESRPHGCAVQYSRETRLEPVSFDKLEEQIKKRQGEIVVVDAWASWCAPCKKEFPRLVELYQRLGKEGVCCMSVSLDKPKNADAALTFLKSQAPLYTNFIMEDGDVIFEKWNFNAVPAVFVFDRQGKLARKFTNDDPDKQFTYDEVIKFVEDLHKRSSGSGK
jgi:peroxiredoxin